MSSTEQVQTSKDKSIIQSIGYKEFSAICDEYGIVEKATKSLLEMASDPDTSERGKISIYKWMIEMKTGKAKQMTDITLQGDDKKIDKMIIEFTDDHIENEALEKKLAEKGMTTDEVQEYVRGYVHDYRMGKFKLDVEDI